MIVKCIRIFFASFLFITQSKAQLCQGSLGDPIINITFGHGANPGGPLSAATTSYQYVSNDCPTDGFYTVRNNTINCFNNTWHLVNADHTGDGNGYFMLVNASLQPGAFYLDTVKGLCGNTTYEFAAWIMNVLLPSSCNAAGTQPNLTFRIEQTDGTILQSFNTNNISSSATPTWKQYGFFFTTSPTNSDIVLRIINNAPGGCGNDLALDDITFRPCGPLISCAIDQQPISTLSFCEGTQHTYTFSCTTSSGFTNPAFQWQSRNSAGVWTDINGANTNTYIQTFLQNSPPGTYEYRLAVAQPGNINYQPCRVYSQPFNITINANPVSNAGNNGPVCEGGAATVNASGGTLYAWSGPNGFAANTPSFTFNNILLSQQGKYYVTVTNQANCSYLDSTSLLVRPSPVATTNFVNVTICAGDSVQLLAQGGTAFQWSPSAGLSAANIYNPKASPATTTLYNVIVSNQFMCRDTATSNVIVNAKPLAFAGPDKIIFKGQTLQLSGSVNGPGNYVWSPATTISDIHSLQPIVNPSIDIDYVLTFMPTSGCGIASDTMSVKVYQGIFIPNAFSPNGDGINDVWNFSSLGACTEFEVFVYSRWGQLVFHTKNSITGWDGKFKGELLPGGIYPYYIKTCMGEGSIKGTVFLMR